MLPRNGDGVNIETQKYCNDALLEAMRKPAVFSTVHRNREALKAVDAAIAEFNFPRSPFPTYEHTALIAFCNRPLAEDWKAPGAPIYTLPAPADRSMHCYWMRPDDKARVLLRAITGSERPLDTDNESDVPDCLRQLLYTVDVSLSLASFGGASWAARLPDAFLHSSTYVDLVEVAKYASYSVRRRAGSFMDCAGDSAFSRMVRDEDNIFLQSCTPNEQAHQGVVSGCLAGKLTMHKRAEPLVVAAFLLTAFLTAREFLHSSLFSDVHARRGLFYVFLDALSTPNASVRPFAAHKYHIYEGVVTPDVLRTLMGDVVPQVLRFADVVRRFFFFSNYRIPFCPDVVLGGGPVKEHDPFVVCEVSTMKRLATIWSHLFYFDEMTRTQCPPAPFQPCVTLPQRTDEVQALKQAIETANICAFRRFADLRAVEVQLTDNDTFEWHVLPGVYDFEVYQWLSQLDPQQHTLVDYAVFTGSAAGTHIAMQSDLWRCVCMAAWLKAVAENTVADADVVVGYLVPSMMELLLRVNLSDVGFAVIWNAYRLWFLHPEAEFQWMEPRLCRHHLRIVTQILCNSVANEASVRRLAFVILMGVGVHGRWTYSNSTQSMEQFMDEMMETGMNANGIRGLVGVNKLRWVFDIRKLPVMRGVSISSVVTGFLPREDADAKLPHGAATKYVYEEMVAHERAMRNCNPAFEAVPYEQFRERRIALKVARHRTEDRFFAPHDCVPVLRSSGRTFACHDWVRHIAQVYNMPLIAGKRTEDSSDVYYKRIKHDTRCRCTALPTPSPYAVKCIRDKLARGNFDYSIVDIEN